MDTIFALSTAPGKSGISVIRVSGSESFRAVNDLCGGIPPPRHASLRKLRDRKNGLLDQAIVICFEEKRSATGEEAAEFHCHGSSAVVAAVLDALSQMNGLRIAEPGEFARRSFENGMLDLSQVEGLADLIESETEAQRRQALQNLHGDLGSQAQIWRSALIRASALIEVGIDFSDEDIPENALPDVMELISDIAGSLKGQIDGFASAERIRRGFEIAIVGAPNVGKSTLLNAVAGRKAAITSEFAGTTRDIIEVRMDIHGLPVTLLDTAGIRNTDDNVEAIGVDLARQRANQADIRVFLIENNEMIDIQKKEDDIVIVAKGDLKGDPGGSVSGKTGKGIDELIQTIFSILKNRTSNAGLATRYRHKAAMINAREALESAMMEIKMNGGRPELISECLRQAIQALDSLTGKVDVECVLDEIFKTFCLGK